MGSYVGEETASNAKDNGLLLGCTEPSRETKGSWWEVFLVKNEIIACVMFDGGVSCGERITKDELHLYCDSPESALEILAANV
jgi:hypothetical protein